MRCNRPYAYCTARNLKGTMRSLNEIDIHYKKPALEQTVGKYSGGEIKVEETTVDLCRGNDSAAAIAWERKNGNRVAGT